MLRVKSRKFRHQVNLDTHLKTVLNQMRRLLMSRLIRILTVSLFNLFFIPMIQIYKKQGCCPNLDDRPNLPDFTLYGLCLHEDPAVVEIILTMNGIPVPSWPMVQSPLHHIAVFSGSDSVSVCSKVRSRVSS